MKWWDKLIEHFNRGYEEEDLELEWEGSSIENWDWDTLMKDRNLLKMKDGFERQKFVRSCVEQMRSASDELDRVSEEYNMVTAYLKDIEEIEALPSGEADICEYYHTAPEIVAKIRELPDAMEVFDSIYNELILPCVMMIETGKQYEAYSMYKAYTRMLQAKYL